MLVNFFFEKNPTVCAQSKTTSGKIFWSATFMSKAKMLLWFFINYLTLQLFSEKKNTSTRFCHLKTMIPRLKSSSEEEAFRKSFQGLSAGASVYTAHLIYKTAFLCCYITSPHSHSTKTHTSSNTSSTPVVLYLQPAVPLSTACFSQRLLRSAPLLIIDWPSTPPDHDLSIILTPFLQQLFSWFWD